MATQFESLILQTGKARCKEVEISLVPDANELADVEARSKGRGMQSWQ
jgi:hypothetical protein